MYHSRWKGTHYDAGFSYGRMLKDHGIVIKGSPTFEITEEMKQFSAEALPLYKRYYPEIVEEIKGMADGQQTSFEQLSQILFPMYCFKAEQHCTCFAFFNQNQIIFGRNSDFLVSIEKLYMNCLYRLDGVNAFNGNTTAFIQMEDGMNQHGLAIGLTFCYPYIRKPGLNAGMLLRYILEKCKTTKQAIEALSTLPIASAQTFTIADARGDIAVVECNARSLVVIPPKENEDFVATANNFNSKQFEQFRTPLGVDDWRSEDRYQTVRDALQNNRVKYSVEFAKSVLAGEYGFICQYDRKKNADTVWSVIYDIKNRRIYRVEGNPSRKKFIEDNRMKFK